MADEGAIRFRVFGRRVREMHYNVPGLVRFTHPTAGTASLTRSVKSTWRRNPMQRNWLRRQRKEALTFWTATDTILNVRFR
jgi:hypothetical protein